MANKSTPTKHHELSGTVKFMRSEDGSPECKCCDGSHVFSRYVDFDMPDDWPEWRGREASDWLNSLLSNETEGMTVKITVEFQPTEKLEANDNA